MGQPKFPKKSFQTPNHPWQGDRIKAEHELRRKFGLKNKTEIWRAQTRLREIRGQARTLISKSRNPDDTQAHKEAGLLLKRLHRQGFVEAEANLNDVLGLDVERILNRRLQSQVYLKGMARTMKQARQFVSHGVVRIGDRRVTVPGYVVRRDEEPLIVFEPTSAVADENHPVRPKPEGYEAVQEASTKEAEATEAPAEAPEAPAQETAPATTPEKADPTARPGAHPAERDEAPAEASEEPNVTETAPAKPEATPDAPAADMADVAPEAPAEAAPEPETTPESDEPAEAAAPTEATPEAETPAEATAEEEPEAHTPEQKEATADEKPAEKGATEKPAEDAAEEKPETAAPEDGGEEE